MRGATISGNTDEGRRLYDRVSPPYMSGTYISAEPSESPIEASEGSETSASKDDSHNHLATSSSSSSSMLLGGAEPHRITQPEFDDNGDERMNANQEESVDSQHQMPFINDGDVNHEDYLLKETEKMSSSHFVGISTNEDLGDSLPHVDDQVFNEETSRSVRPDRAHDSSSDADDSWETPEDGIDSVDGNESEDERLESGEAVQDYGDIMLASSTVGEIESNEGLNSRLDQDVDDAADRAADNAIEIGASDENMESNEATTSDKEDEQLESADFIVNEDCTNESGFLESTEREESTGSGQEEIPAALSTSEERGDGLESQNLDAGDEAPYDEPLILDEGVVNSNSLDPNDDSDTPALKGTNLPEVENQVLEEHNRDAAEPNYDDPENVDDDNANGEEYLDSSSISVDSDADVNVDVGIDEELQNASIREDSSGSHINELDADEMEDPNEQATVFVDTADVVTSSVDELPDVDGQFDEPREDEAQSYEQRDDLLGSENFPDESLAVESPADALGKGTESRDSMHKFGASAPFIGRPCSWADRLSIAINRRIDSFMGLYPYSDLPCDESIRRARRQRTSISYPAYNKRDVCAISPFFGCVLSRPPPREEIIF